MAPTISVVIPTRGREARLAFALDALARQTLGADEFEVVVIRPDSAAGPYAQPPPGLRIRSETSAAPGPAAMRNRGWRSARGELVAFTDDDCRPSPQWLQALVDEARKAGADVIVQGRTAPDPDELHLLYGLARTVDVPAASGLYETCNIVYPRELLERLEGFDEAFLYPHGEDTDLGIRARRMGARLRFADGAIVWHAVHAQPLHRAVRGVVRREGIAQVLAKHPELRARLMARLFVKRSHAALAAGPVLALSLRGFGRRRKRTRLLAGALPYLLHSAEGFLRGGPITPRRLARLALHLPAAAVLDAAELIATVRGAIRHRTPVL